jgi:hypothetical protein
MYLGLCVTYWQVLDWMVGFIDTLYTPLGTTCNYSAIDDLHSLQFTAANTSVLSLLHAPLAISWQWIHKSLSVSHCNFKSHMKSSLHSLILSCHYSQSPLTADSLNSPLQLPILELDSILILATWDPCCIASGRTHRKHCFLYCCMLIQCCVATGMAQTHREHRLKHLFYCWVTLQRTDAFFCCMCTSHYLATAVSLPPQFLLLANMPHYLEW